MVGMKEGSKEGEKEVLYGGRRRAFPRGDSAVILILSWTFQWRRNLKGKTRAGLRKP